MICFALIAHKDEQALQNQIMNIRKYNPKDSFIVFFNGGNDPNFGKRVCKEEHVMYCPYSRPLGRGTGGYFLYEVMRWLEEGHVPYEYLVYMEYDIMFVNPGFRDLLLHEMEGCDCMVRYLKKESDPEKPFWPPAKQIWNNWGKLEKLLQSDHFYWHPSPMTVYRHGIVKRILSEEHKTRLENILRTTNIKHLGEMLYMTLAKKHGAKVKPYPKPHVRFVRWRPGITMEEIKKAKSKPEIMFVHPVKDAQVREWIFNN